MGLFSFFYMQPSAVTNIVGEAALSPVCAFGFFVKFVGFQRYVELCYVRVFN